MIESFPQRVVRHLKDGDFRATTLLSGIRQMREWLGNRETLDSQLTVLKKHSAYAKVDNLQLMEMARLSPDQAKRRLFTEKVKPKVFFYSFPPDSKLSTLVKSEPQFITRILEEELDTQDGPVAQIIGPTVAAFSRYRPNNGFYDRSTNQSYVFGELPPGQTRGALVTLSTGETKIIDDAQKKQYIENNFEGVETMIGCCYFLTNIPDAENEQPFEKDSGKGIVSYLIEVVTESGKTNIHYFVSTQDTTRTQSSQYIDELITDTYGKAQKWRAVELEYTSAGCLVKDTSGKIHTETEVYKQNTYRPDAILITLPKK